MPITTANLQISYKEHVERQVNTRYVKLNIPRHKHEVLCIYFIQVTVKQQFKIPSVIQRL